MLRVIAGEASHEIFAQLSEAWKNLRSCGLEVSPLYRSKCMPHSSTSQSSVCTSTLQCSATVLHHCRASCLYLTFLPSLSWAKPADQLLFELIDNPNLLSLPSQESECRMRRPSAVQSDLPCRCSAAVMLAASATPKLRVSVANICTEDLAAARFRTEPSTWPRATSHRRHEAMAVPGVLPGLETH